MRAPPLLPSVSPCLFKVVYWAWARKVNMEGSGKHMIVRDLVAELCRNVLIHPSLDLDFDFLVA